MERLLSLNVNTVRVLEVGGSWRTNFTLRKEKTYAFSRKVTSNDSKVHCTIETRTGLDRTSSIASTFSPN
uniref:Uncharacterized protein n=1 Tax=Megaselia scalaris TaxID=36166 RepID=T1GHH3_MEGSC